MKKYVRPIVLVNDELAEGVYAASGSVGEFVENGGGEDGGMEVSTDCWTVEVTLAQRDAGDHANFRVAAVHPTSVQHISLKTVVTVVFDDTVTDARFEGFDVSINGSTVTLTRESHANAYGSGDNYNTLLEIYGPNFKTINVSSYGIECTHGVNVQGGYD